jgi:carbamoyl-phosphate synthase large subunit
VVKIPRWDLNKFSGVTKEIGSSMKSVGEVMAIGRSFEEAIQKGLRMIGQGMHGFTANKELVSLDIEQDLQKPTDLRIFVIAHAFKQGFSVQKIHELTKIDHWFLYKLEQIIQTENFLTGFNTLDEISRELMWDVKKKGFSDFQLARIILKSDDEVMEDAILKVRTYRKQLGVVPVVKQIDTLAGEFPAQTNYLVFYLSWYYIRLDT